MIITTKEALEFDYFFLFEKEMYKVEIKLLKKNVKIDKIVVKFMSNGLLIHTSKRKPLKRKRIIK